MSTDGAISIDVPKLYWLKDLSHKLLNLRSRIILLQQQENGTSTLIYYFSTLLTNAKRKYGRAESECLAILRGKQHLRIYLKGIIFTLRMDHALLKQILNLTNRIDRLTRWHLGLSESESA